jgi:hypothetical protein
MRRIGMLGTQHIPRNITRHMPRGKLLFQTAQVRTVRMTRGPLKKGSNPVAAILTGTQRGPNEKPPAKCCDNPVTGLDIASTEVGYQ